MAGRQGIDKEVVLRAQGALVGQAAGDALGTTVEFRDRESIARMFPEGVRDLIGGGPYGLLPGQITDDTELALALARSLVEHGKFDDDAVAARYVAWYASDPFDIGRTTRQAFRISKPSDQGLAETIRSQASWDSQANGSLMRQSPLGVFGWCMDEQDLADLSCRDSTLSHPHPTCQESCVAYTHAMAFAIRTGGTPRDVYEDTLTFVRSRPSSKDTGVIGVLETASKSPPGNFSHQMGWVLIALRNAFHRLLHAESLEEGIIETVRCGGDTDTNGCIAGALMGSVFGLPAIPERWSSVLLGCQSNRPSEYQCSDILDLAQALCAHGASGDPAEPST